MAKRAAKRGAEKRSTAKQQVRHLLRQLPDDCTIEDIQYHLHVIEKVERGFRSIDESGGVPHDEVKRRMYRAFVVGTIRRRTKAADRGEFASKDEVKRRMGRWLKERN